MSEQAATIDFPASAAPADNFREILDTNSAASRRIRQVRRSLLQSSASRVQSQLQSRSPTSMDPGHEAITLSGHGWERSQRVQALQRFIPTAPHLSLERLQHAESPREPSAPSAPSVELPPISPVIGPYDNSSRRASTSLNSPTSPQRPSLPPRRSVLETLIPRRDSSSDDPFTILGRRVAAREALSRSSEPSSSRSEPRTINRISQLQHDMDSYRNLRQRRSDPVYGERINTVARPRSIEVQSRGNDSSAVSIGHSPTSIYPRRWRMSTQSRDNSGTTRQSSSSTDRLSLLSNFSVQNLSSPVSATLARPLLFEEPSSIYEDSTYLPPEASGSNYIRPRYNSDGSERSQDFNPHLDLEEDEPVWIATDRGTRQYGHRRDDTIIAASSNTPLIPLRRPDADFPPSDESSANLSNRRLYLTSIVDSVLSNQEDVTLLDETSTLVAPQMGEKLESFNSKPEKEVIGTSTPFRPNPLPTPLSEMISSYVDEEVPAPVRVASSACFAGR